MVAPVSGARVLRLPGSVLAAWSDASRGDLRPRRRGPDGRPPDGGALVEFAGDAAAAERAPVGTVYWTEQVHGSRVLDVGVAGDAVPDGLDPVLVCSGEGDALVADRPGAALCVLTADCGALALASPEGVCAAVHAGWRGLLSGVVEAAVDRMRDRGATEVVGALGPCIHAGCYEFSGVDLDAVAAVYGDGVRARTTRGRPALDLPAGIAAAVARAGARSVDGVDACTACDDGFHSHRARGDVGRQALLVWSSPAAGSGP